MTAPRAPRRPFVRRFHGDEVPDPYAWMADRADPALLAHLRAENDHSDAVTSHLDPLRQAVFEEIKAATQETDLTVPESYRGWWYYTRTVQGSQYPIAARVKDAGDGTRPDLDVRESAAGAAGVATAVPAGEQILVDGNVEAAGSGFFALGAAEVSLDGERVALAMDLVGDERFAVSVREIVTGAVIDDAVTDIGYGLVWAADSEAFYYTRVDEAWRPYQVWHHVLGADPASDTLILQEDDDRFWLGLGSSRDDRWLVIALGSKNTSEVHLVDLFAVTGVPARDELVCVSPRREGVEYDVEPAGDRLLIVHNLHRPDFELSWAPMNSIVAEDWRTVLSPAPGERVVGVDAFAGHAVVSLRRDGLTAVRILPRDASLAAGFRPGWDLPVDEPLYTIAVQGNPEWSTNVVRVSLESFVTPKTIAEFDVSDGGHRQASVLKQTPVLGYDPAELVQTRAWASAQDGASIPISLVRHRDTATPAPGVLYGYGAYEISLDPWFSIGRLSLLRRGVVFAVAHVRGGGELGRSWYEQGRLAAKTTSFTDLDACAEYLVTSGVVEAGRLGLEGGSAGGLLVGAALNLAPQRYRVVHADVPFVDALTTILDPSLPLSVPEWEEWGDPLHDPNAYARMKSYTPYENIRALPYPAILATSSLNDTRVYVTEPAKWVARLRDTVTSEESQRPILLRTEMEAGHGGRSGRYDAWHQYAWELAFVLDQLGVAGAVVK